MKSFAGLLVAAVGVAAGGGGDGYGEHVQLSTWVDYKPQYEYSTKTWNKPCTTTAIWSEPGSVSSYTTTSISYKDHTIPVTSYVPCTTTLPGQTFTSISVYTSPTTEIITATRYIDVTHTSLITVTNTVTQNNTIVSFSATTETKLSSVTLPGSTVTQLSIVPSLVTRPAETITLSGKVTTLSPQVVTATATIEKTTATTVRETSIQPTTVNNTVIRYTTISDEETIVRTLTLPAPPPIPTTVDNTIIEHTTIRDEETIVETLTLPAPPPITVTIPTTITVAPAPSGCTNSPSVPEANSLGCQGRGCSIEFSEGAAVHWVERTDLPPLVTALTYVDTARSATCITTQCNTAVFNQFYSTSATACARAPCPSNTIDCHCSIVVGPIILPDDSTTSVTQIGGSGWNLNLGPIQTARDVGRCGPGGNECVTATTQTLSTNLVYTGAVSSTTIGNGTYAQSVRYLLPGLQDYFPPDSPFGDCTVAVLSTAGSNAPLRKRDNGGFDSKLDLWPGCNQITAQVVRNVAAGAANLPTTSASITTTSPAEQTPSALPPSTVTIAAPTEPSTPVAPAPGSTNTENTVEPSSPTSTPSQPATSPTSTPIQPATSPTSTPSQPATSPTSTPSQPATSPTSSSLISIRSSTATPTESRISGAIYVTETVYYSMILSPEQQSVLSAYASSASTSSTPAPQQPNAASSVHKEPGHLLTLLLMLVGLM